jgi:hypothetical protein
MNAIMTSAEHVIKKRRWPYRPPLCMSHEVSRTHIIAVRLGLSLSLSCAYPSATSPRPFPAAISSYIWSLRHPSYTIPYTPSLYSLSSCPPILVMRKLVSPVYLFLPVPYIAPLVSFGIRRNRRFAFVSRESVVCTHGSQCPCLPSAPCCLISTANLTRRTWKENLVIQSIEHAKKIETDVPRVSLICTSFPLSLNLPFIQHRPISCRHLQLSCAFMTSVSSSRSA